MIKNNIINIKKIINEKEVYESIIILIQKVDDKNIYNEEAGIKNKKYYSILQDNLKGKECMYIIINKNENYNFIDVLNINKVISNFEESPETSKNIIIKYLR